MFQIAGQIILMSSDQPWQLGFKFLECQISVVTEEGGRGEVSLLFNICISWSDSQYVAVEPIVCPSVSQCVISWEQCSDVWFLPSPGETTEQDNWSTVSPQSGSAQSSAQSHCQTARLGMSLNLNHENWLTLLSPGQWWITQSVNIFLFLLAARGRTGWTGWSALLKIKTDNDPG